MKIGSQTSSETRKLIQLIAFFKVWTQEGWYGEQCIIMFNSIRFHEQLEIFWDKPGANITDNLLR